MYGGINTQVIKKQVAMNNSLLDWGMQCNLWSQAQSTLYTFTGGYRWLTSHFHHDVVELISSHVGHKVMNKHFHPYILP